MISSNPLSNSQLKNGADAVKQAGQIYTDLNSMQAIKQQAGGDREAAMRAVAKQFESLFVNMMMKQMRASNEVFGKDSYLSSDEIKFHQQMLDQQMAIKLSEGRGLGLADVIYRQLSQDKGAAEDASTAANAKAVAGSPMIAGNPLIADNDKALAAFDRAAAQFSGTATTPVHAMPDIADPVAVSVDGDVLEALQASGVFDETPDLEALQAQMARFYASAAHSSRNAERVRQIMAGAETGSPEAFIQRAYHAAKQVAQRLGVDVQAVLAQSALESGWGENADNNNLFGIKADGRWSGDRSMQSTLEFRGGVLARENAWFRRYPSWDQSFSDYADMISANPRYQQALEAGSDPHAYAQALQRAGYATDPNYARKISDIINSDRFQTALSHMALLDASMAPQE